jgi:LAO/AO transport system kinase
MSTRPTDPAALLDAAQGGDRVALARLLSYVERGGEQSRQVAHLAYQSPGRAYTVGLTGAPGSGKSTLTDRLIGAVREKGFPTEDAASHAATEDAATDGATHAASADSAHQVAVLAIDPSSPFTGGAILGDRVRMQDHALDDGVYIRSMATRGHLGGLALATPQALRVLDAAGFPWVVVETVGVGQVEVEVAAAADTTVVVVNPGWGDSVQANKAGLLEIADIFVINKADRPGVAEARSDLRTMLELSNLAHDAWLPPIVATVAESGEGVDELWAAIAEHRARLESTGGLARRRSTRLLDEIRQIVARSLEDRAYHLTDNDDFADLVAEVEARQLDPYEAAQRVLDPKAPPPDL